MIVGVYSDTDKSREKEEQIQGFLFPKQEQFQCEIGNHQSARPEARGVVLYFK